MKKLFLPYPFAILVVAAVVFGPAEPINASGIRPAQAVPNDQFANATTLAGAMIRVTGSNVGATREPGEPRHEGNEGGRSVWWTWTSPFTGTAEVSTRGSGFSTLLGVYVGSSVDSLLEVTADDLFDGLLFAAVGGTTYRIAVDGWSGATGNIALSISLFPRPANDQFAAAAVITGASNTVTGSNAGATREAGEPYHAQGNTAHSVWWTWTAPFSGGAVVTTTGDFSLVSAVYVGDSVDRLTEVANSTFNSSIIFEPVAGTTYHIVVDGRFAGEMGNFTLMLRLSPPPANDSFAGAFSIVAANATVQGSNLAATKETGEPEHGGFPGGHSVWWSWTAPFTGGVEMSTDGSDFHNLLGVYTGASVNNLALVAQDGRIFSQNSRVIFRAVMGTTYRIAVDGWEGAVGTVRLKVALSASPANDQFIDGYVITGASNTVSGSNVGASREPGEPDHTGSAVGRSVWWTWTAPFTGEVELSTFGSGFSAVVLVYLGDSVESLTRVANSSFTGRYQVSGGRTYHIAVDGWNGESGRITLSLNLGLPPTNDRFADAIPIVGSSNVVAGSNQGASKEPGEPNHAGSSGGHSVWWTWTAPATGGVEVSATVGNSSSLLAVYIGASVDRLTEVASSSFSFAPAIFRVVGGTTYHIAVDDQNGLSGAVQLRVTLFPPVVNDQFADAVVIAGASNTVHGSNAGATKEPGEPRHDFNAGGRSVWWRWTAPSAGGAEVRTDGSGFRTVLGVYTGSSVAALTVIATSGFSDPVLFEVVSGITYWLAVDGVNGEAGNITLKVTSFPPPANDQFTNALVLSGATNTVRGSNFGATKEAGEPVHGVVGGKSVWWNWTAPFTGEVELRAEGFDPLLGVYTGDSVDGLIAVAPLIGSSGTFRAVGGTTYHIAVDSPSGRAGDYSLSVTLLAPPANDQFTNAIAVQGINVTVHGSNLGASLEPGEPDHGGYRGGHSVWWTWTAPATGGVEINAEGNFFFIPVLAVYTGQSPDRLTPVGTSMGYSGPVVFRAVVGTTYRIAVDGLNQESGDVTLSVRLFPPVANDQFVDAVEIPGPGPDYTVSGSNVGATKEPGESDHAGVPSGRSVWWTWTAPRAGAAEVRTAGSEVAVSVGIYTGNSIESLTEVGRIERFDREVVFDVQGGTTYHIAVDGNAGNIVLGVTFFPPPANDRFADAIPITGPIRTVVGSNVGASKEAGEPNHASPAGGQAGGHSVWWNWTAPATGGVEIKAATTTFSTLLAVYTGDSLDRLRLVGFASFSTPAIFRAVGGTTYRIAVDGWDGRVGEIELGLRLFPPVANDQFEDAIVLTGPSHSVRGSNVGATKEPGEPDHDFDSGGRSVWWSWTAPFTGGVEANTAGSDFGTLLDVYMGDSVDHLAPVARLNFHEPIIFDAVAGTTYHIAVDGRNGQAGNILLRLNLSSPPPNDQFADAIAIVGAANTLRGSNTSASKEPGEPEHGNAPGGHSVWWRWTAPFSGEVSLGQEGTFSRRWWGFTQATRWIA